MRSLQKKVLKEFKRELAMLKRRSKCEAREKNQECGIRQPREEKIPRRVCPAVSHSLGI